MKSTSHVEPVTGWEPAAVSEPLKLYEHPGSRSTRVWWMLKELGLEYESIRVDLVQGEQRRPEFLEVNPCGKVPVLVDGDTVVTESAAICTWLAERYPEKKLIPPAGSVSRAHYYQWTYFCLAELEPFLWSIRKHMLLYDKDRRSHAAIKLAKEEYRDNVAALSLHLRGQEYVLGEAFSAADIIIGFNLLWGEQLRLIGGFAPLNDYLARLRARPFFPQQGGHESGQKSPVQ